RYHSIALPPGAVTRGEIVEPHVVTGALKALWKRGKFSTRRVVVGVGTHRALARELTVPAAPPPLIRESLPLQVQALLPVPRSGALLDSYPSAVAGHGDVHAVLIAAV